MKTIKLNVTPSELSNLTNALEATADFWDNEVNEMKALLVRMKKLGEDTEKTKAPRRKRKTKAEKAAEAWPLTAAAFQEKDTAS